MSPRSLSALPRFPAFRHIGIYAYRAGFLKTYGSLLPQPSSNIEALEQLRALWHGYKISVARNRMQPAQRGGYLEDLERVRKTV